MKFPARGEVQQIPLLPAAIERKSGVVVNARSMTLEEVSIDNDKNKVRE